MTPREQFRKDVAATLTEWRFGCIPPRPNGAMTAIFHEGMADLIRLRLYIAYMPLFQGLERIEHRVKILAELKREPWAHPQHAVNRGKNDRFLE